MFSKRWVVAVLFVLSTLVSSTTAFSAQSNQVSNTGSAGQPLSQGQMQGQTVAVPAPALTTPAYLTTPPVPSAAQVERSQAEVDRIRQAWAARTEANPNHPVSGPTSGTSTMGPGPGAGAASIANVPSFSGASPQAAGDFTVFLNTALSPTTGAASIQEPSSATEGRNVFYTGNWYAARSTGAGTNGSWTYLNPYSDMADFCCDENVVWDPARNLYLWERLGIYNYYGDGQGAFALSASTNNMSTYCTYRFTPSNLDSTYTNQWFDYPHFYLSNNDVYITANIFNAAGYFQRMVLLRMPLDQIATCSGFGYTWWNQTTGWTWEGVQGATTAMYLGDTTNSAGTFQVLTQNESDTTLYWSYISVPAWTFTNGNGVCTVPNGYNPCARADQRITGAWVSKGRLGFFWNVAQGGGFSYPYINAATFDQNTLAYTGQPLFWNSSAAFQYGDAAPNVRGDVGVTFQYAGGGVYPYIGLAIWDDFTAPPPGWQVSYPNGSTSWNASNSGDYLTVRKLQPLGTVWTAANYIGVLNGSSVTYQPHYIVFGRGRDHDGAFRFGSS